MKKTSKTLLSLLFTTALVLGMSACKPSNESTGSVNSSQNSSSEAEEIVVIDPTTVELAFGDFHTPEQAAYLLSTYTEISQFAKGTQELSLPRAGTVEWEESEGTEAYYLQLSMQEDFSDAVTYRTEKNSFDLYNLYVACDYYWRVAEEEAMLADAQVNSFRTTESAPRNLYVDGITNVRDIGGWLTEDGKRVKQGMLYRGGRLNTSSSDTFILELTEKGQDTFCNELGIKTEIDLRETDNNEIGSVGDYVVEGVNYCNIPMDWSGNIVTSNIEELKQLFSILADSASYPVYFHCNIGTDRTGLVAFLCNALMGVSEQDLYRDYLFSNFGNIGSLRTLGLFQSYYGKAINNTEGNTFSEKTANYLIGRGIITQEQIDSIRSILFD